MIQTLFSRKVLVSAILATLISFSFAQKTKPQLDELRKKLLAEPSVESAQFSEVLKTPSLISFRAGAQKKMTITASLKKYFELSVSDELRLVSTTQLKNNLTVDRYKQFHKGIIVEHSAYIVISKNEEVLSVSAESFPLSEAFSVIPLQSGDALVQKALNFYQAKMYSWEALEDDKKRYAGNPVALKRLEEMKKQYMPKAELVIAKDLYGDGQARLAYKYDILAVNPVSRYKIYVDANTGKILLSDAVIKHVGKQREKADADPLDKLANFQFYGLIPDNFIPKLQSPESLAASVLASALTRYSGTRQIYTTKVSVPVTGKPDPNNPNVLLTYSGVDPRQPIPPSDVWILMDQTRGDGIETYDCNGAGGIPLNLPQIQEQALAFVDRDNIWKNEADQGVVTKDDLIRGATANGTVGADEAANDDIAIDAHWGAEMVYDYWKKRHNRSSFDNKNGAIKSYIHYGPAYDNAFWNGASMTYGDGSGTSAAGYRPLVSLDVCGHEIGHGVCSFTSDLVYASESGAMNEGLSDIWAAAVENFVDDSVKISATPTYQYFQVGEQISADNIGLRRMDNPKAKTDPDTYGGRYWQNPNCTPNLANDQCGVHGNSGVLNKWFYLVVMGPNQTTGSPAYTDDGRADAGTAVGQENLGNNYGTLPNFTGLGFERAEEITYLMELMLTPNATFLEARAASIAAARTLFGECSQPERTITNAWFGVGVGAAFTTCAAPLLTVAANTNVGEGAPGDCPRYTDLKVNANLTIPQGTATTITFTVTGGTLGAHEYQLINNTITYNSNETGLKTVPVLRIFDDAVFEPNETINLTATAASVGYTTSITFTIRDNDTLPTIGGTVVLLTENFESTALGARPDGWAQIDKTTTPPIEWRVRANGTAPLSWAGKRMIVEQKLLPGQATYDQLVESQIIVRTPLINGTGLDSLRIEFTYQAGGEPACTPACDYGKLMYSYDGVSFSSIFPEDSALYLQPTDRRAVYDLPKQLANRQFYIGFLWNNDANAGTSASITIDDVVVTGKGKKIAEDSMSVVTEPIPSVAEEGNKPSHLYSKFDGALMSRLVNASSNLGCVKDTLVQSGKGFVPFGTGMRSKKVHQITPSQNSNATYTLTLYYTNAELQGQNPATLLLMKSNAATIDASNTGNSVTVTPTREDKSAQGYWSYTATFTGFSLFALVTSGPIITTYYPRTSATDLSQPSHWTTDPAGTAGTSPSNFTSSDQEFNINNNVANPAVLGTWTISGGSNVTLNNSNGLSFEATARLNVGTGSTFNFNNMRVTLRSASTGTASIGITTGAITNASNVTAERFTSNKRAWRLLGVPYSVTPQTIKAAWQEGATLLVQNPNPPYGTHITTFAGDARVANYDAARPASSIRIYAADNFNSDLAHTPNTLDNIALHQSYFLFVRGDRSTDRTFSTAPSSVANLRINGTPNMGNVTRGVLGTSFSLISNPYPSALDFDAVKAIPANASINRFYVWDATLAGTNGVGQYRTIDVTGTAPNFTYTATPGTLNNSWRFIEQGTAFFVPGSRTVDFTENTKAAGNPPSSMLRTVGTATELVVNLHKVNTDNSASLADGVRLLFDHTYTASIDNNDAKKITGFELNLGILNHGELLAIDKRPLPQQDDVIPLSLSHTVPGRYIFEIQPANYPAGLVPYLRDKFLNTYSEINLNADTQVEFAITADASSSAADRFSIVFKRPGANANPAIVIYPNPVSNGTISVQLNNMPKGSYVVRLVNALGQTVLTRQVEHAGGSSTQTIGVNRIKGTYGLEIIKPDNSKQTNKIVIN